VVKAYGSSVYRFFSPEFKKFLYSEFYDIALDILIDVLYEEIYEEREYRRFEDWVSYSVEEIFNRSYIQDFIIKYFPGVPIEDGELSEYWKDHIRKPVKIFVRETIQFLRKY
jgi:hypothetical protein